ncbi:hypothetical protein BDI4_540020 [Burkholderia diffusa]|nr:hypothetical protein BDI4_540020 [Burkholderia diffusa]
MGISYTHHHEEAVCEWRIWMMYIGRLITQGREG